MPKERVAVYIDGFNLYHAIKDLKERLKWLNLMKLANLLIGKNTQEIVSVKYFSALGNHFSNTEFVHRLTRHRAYVKALEAKGVDVRLGNFAKRDMHYSSPRGSYYRAKWRRYEEKQTDVGIAVNLINDAHLDLFDRALVISLDTDMIPAFKAMAEVFPHKKVVCVAPPSRPHHREIQLLNVELGKIKTSQLEQSLFGSTIVEHGKVIARRPKAYDPPT